MNNFVCQTKRTLSHAILSLDTDQTRFPALFDGHVYWLLILIRCFFPLIVIGRCNSSNGSYLVYLCSYVWSGFIVLLGIFLNVYSKNETRINAWLAQNGSQYLKLFLRRQKGTPFMENVWYEMRSSIYHGARELCQDIEMSFCGVEKFPETGKILRNISLVR